MAISQTQRTELLQLLVAMFDAAPGSDVLDELANGIDAGNTIQMYAANLVNSTEFTGIYSRALTANEFATKFIGNLLGSNVTAETTAEAVAFIEARLNAGASRDTVILEAVSALQSVPETDTKYGAAVAQLSNKVEVAEYFGTQSSFTGLSLSQMQAALSGVTSDDATVTAKKSAIDSGNLDGVGSEGTTFTLTTGVDALTGTSSNDTFTADNTGAAEVTSTADSLSGGRGTDTLNIFSDGTIAALPALDSIEALNV
ncbi:MAG: hypothetical protein KC467_14330, partial [Marinomonas atlantica]|nr:hypothetical protein [Marinomonas atlantica]